jgi:plasmid stabilization system protein ParE
MPLTFRVIVSPEAFEAMDGVLDFIAPQSPANAARVIDRLWESMQSLKDLPHRYSVVSGRRQPKRAVRRMPVGPYLVYYRVDDASRVVRILTVRHGSRRQPRRFK